MLAKGTGRYMRIPGRCMRIACIKIGYTRDSLFQKRNMNTNIFRNNGII